MNVQQKLALSFIRTKLNVLATVNKNEAASQAFKLFCTPFAKYTPAESEVFLKAKKIDFNFNGNTIRGYQCNHPREKKVLILHGFSSSCQNFESYVEPFIQKDYEVLAFDAPAHGSSEGSTVNALEYSEMVKKVIELHGPVQYFLAHSFGGLAVSLALEDIPHDENTKIVLIAPATETSTAIDNAFKLIGIRNPSMRKSIDELILKISGKETAWFSIRRAVKNINATILWIHDDDDDVTPVQDAKEVEKDNNGNIRFVFTKGLGHRRIYKDPNVKDLVFSFL